MHRGNPGPAGTSRLMAIFTLSGFSGLIYQSIWSHYLGLTLGHAAYAQTLVLAIFMGGLAVGSWLASRWIPRLADAVLAYAAIEALIGTLGLLFHPAFVAYTGFSQDTVLPALAPAWVHAYQWGTAALLILPQCVLLGMTFPLMATACLRIAPQEEGRALGGLYFSNSLGAAVGALVATFVLLPAIGMPGAMFAAGVTNLLVALLARSIARAIAAPPVVAVATHAEGPAPGPRFLHGILLAAAITGATSFVYEIVWVRMLDMALGTTLHSFELMLAAFILGLAAGGYWIHRRGDATRNATWLAGVAQVAMGLCALASALAFNQSFQFVAWLMHVLPRTDAGYGWFNLGSAGVALLVMFPTAFFAGSTLPLFTMSLLRRGEGEPAVGWVYATNTLGAIVGVLLAVHVLVPLLGLHLSLLLAASVDVALGVVLLALFGEQRAERDKRVGLLAGLVMLAVALVLGRVDPLVASSGVYRTGLAQPPKDWRLRFVGDGKTSTVSVFDSEQGRVVTIATNGKPDAGLVARLDIAPVDDEVTMVMAGALPLALHPHPAEVAVIGWGSGLTTHTLLGSPAVQRVETVEIEPTMVHGARVFGDRVRRGYADPRSTIVYDDARSYFSAARKHYDVLVSEPSNPWVSGVASLFTQEFYGFARRHLKPGGLLVQWLQSYEITDELQSRIIAALLERFPYVDVYLTNASDLVLVASADRLPALDVSRLEYPPLDDETVRVGLVDAQAFGLRRIGGREVLEAYVRANNGQAGHSDFYPEVALRAPKARFMDQYARMLPTLTQNGLPVLDMVDGREVPRLQALAPWDQASSIVGYQRYAGMVNASFNDPAMLARWQQGDDPELTRAMARVLAVSRAPIVDSALPAWSRDLAALARYGPGSLATEDVQDSWVAPKWLAPGQGPAVQAIMAAYRAAALRNAVGMRRFATAVLARPAGLSVEMRQQMLLIAMLGAAGQRDRKAMHAYERDYGGNLPHDATYYPLRRFLLAW